MMPSINAQATTSVLLGDKGDGSKRDREAALERYAHYNKDHIPGIIEQGAAKNGKAVPYETKCYSQLACHRRQLRHRPGDDRRQALDHDGAPRRFRMHGRTPPIHDHQLQRERRPVPSKAHSATPPAKAGSKPKKGTTTTPSTPSITQYI